MSLPRVTQWIRYECWIAARYLRSRRSRSKFVPTAVATFSFIGITLGVATLILVMSVMNGFHHKLLDKILSINGHVFVAGHDRPLTDYVSIRERLQALPGIALVFPVVEGAASISSPHSQTGALVRGITEQDLTQLPGLKNNILYGTIRHFDTSQTILLGQSLADNLGVTVGDPVSLLTAKGSQTPFGVAPRIKTYTVGGIFHLGMSELDTALVYLPFREAQIYFNKEDQASLLEVFLHHPEAIDKLHQKLHPLLEENGLVASDWRWRNKSFFDALAMESNVMFLILSMIVLVAMLNIISGLILLVQDKARSIAILRTMGASRGSILRIFLMTGTSIGILGTIAGLCIGLTMAYHVESIRQFMNWVFQIHIFPSDIYFLSELPSQINFMEVILVTCMSFTLSFLATLYPAWRAAQLDPVEVLRHE